MNEPTRYSEQTFETIKNVNEYGEEYWLARELQPVLEYAQWRRFEEVIERARLACRNSGYDPEDHFADVGKMAETPREYAIFQNKGYQGLYGGLGAKEIHARKGLGRNQKILDHMGSTELAANLFRATQTDEKLRREKVQGKQAAYDTHYEVGRKVRQTIRELGGTMPEDLPTPEKSIAQIEREQDQRRLRPAAAQDKKKK